MMKECSYSCSLSASRNPDRPWLAVGVRLERQHKPVEKKLVHLIDCGDPQNSKCCYSIEAGKTSNLSSKRLCNFNYSIFNFLQVTEMFTLLFYQMESKGTACRSYKK